MAYFRRPTHRLSPRVASVALLLVACAAPAPGPAEPPEWVETREHPQYPNELYLLGVGTTVHRNRDIAYREAHDRAVADIAGQLETRIQSEVTTFVRESIRIRNERMGSDMLSRVSSNVKAVTAATLRAIRPVVQHHEATTGFTCALVAIKRSDFARQARQDLTDLDDKIRPLDETARRLADGGNLYRAVARYRQLEQLLLERATVQAEADFVAPGLKVGKPIVSLGEVFARRGALAGKIELFLHCTHEEFGQRASASALEKLFVSRFRELGVKVRPTRDRVARSTGKGLWNTPDSLRRAFADVSGYPLLLVCEVTTTSRPAGFRDLIAVRSQGTARLLNPKTGELLITAAYAPDVSGGRPAVGGPRRKLSLAEEALTRLAEYLARRVFEEI